MQRVFSLIVDNNPGVLSRISGLFTRRGYSIDSISAGVTADPRFTRITIVAQGDELILSQIEKQVAKLEEIRRVKVLRPEDSVFRELIMVKVRANKAERAEIISVVDIFRAKVVDVEKESLMVEMTGAQSKIEAFLNMLDGYEILELASLGANVLHNRSVEAAKKFNVKLEVVSSFTHETGTAVKEVNSVEKMLIRGVARDNDTARISLIDIEDTPGKAFSVFSIMAKKNINVDIILQSIGRDGKKDISFTVPESSLESALEALSENMSVIGAAKVLHDSNVSKVSIVGAGMASNPGVAAKMFEALYNANINIQMIATSEIKVSVLVERAEAEAAVRVIHEKFNLANI